MAPGHEIELEEIEAVSRGMNVAKYRDHAEDVYIRAYLLLKRVHKEEGQKLIFGIIRQAIEQNDAYIMESGIFALKSLIDDFEKTTSQTLLSLFLKESIEKILESQHI